MLRFLMTLTLLAAFALPASAAYKCKSATGGVSFQDAPCAGGAGQAITLQPNGNIAVPGVATPADKLVQDGRIDTAIAEAMRERRPLVGMTAAQLNESMGLATRVNTDKGHGATREQAIFERPNETWYVYTRNGRVESFQHRPGPPLGASAAPGAVASRGPCASSQEIRNAQTAASSIALSDAERTERLRSIRAMQSCLPY